MCAFILQDANAWALLGHTYYLTGNFPSAKDAYERTVDYVTPPAHLNTVLLRLAEIYFKDKQVCLNSLLSRAGSCAMHTEQLPHLKSVVHFLLTIENTLAIVDIALSPQHV